MGSVRGVDSLLAAMVYDETDLVLSSCPILAMLLEESVQIPRRLYLSFMVWGHSFVIEAALYKSFRPIEYLLCSGITNDF